MLTSSESLGNLPPACPVAFKEWAGVVAALADGRQSLILRKGGIDEAEGPGRFRAEHDAFWLYPTWVHQAQQGLRVDAPEPPDDLEAFVPLTSLARVVDVARLDDPDLLPKLEPFHVWTEETVARRFRYRQPGLWVLTVRVFQRPKPLRWPVTPAQAGCKTWVDLEGEPPSQDGLTPALGDAEFDRRREAIRETLASRGVSA